MESFLKSLDSGSVAGLFWALCGAVAVLLGLCLWLGWNLKRTIQRWGHLISGSDGRSLEPQLQECLDLSREISVRLEDAQERIGVVEGKMKSAKRYVGLVRYDAFDDIGGSQSFSLAVYDEEGNGAVVTSQVGREGCRVYGKSLVSGRSERHLTTEEEEAIQQAVSSRPRPRITT